MRPLVSYNDISSSAAKTDAQPSQLGPQIPSTNQPPTKRRRTNQKAPQYRRPPPQRVQHWDEPGSSAQEMNYGDDTTEYGNTSTSVGVETYDEGIEEEEEEEEESRELTHQEIWDDSALIDAWNSAAAEYETYHGSSKNWKEEPVKKSPLWYNVPPSPSKTSKKRALAAPTSAADDTTFKSENIPADANSQPLNFDTFVPTHDPSLASAVPPHPPVVPGPDYAQFYLQNPPGPMVGQDEAFQRALSAMYWGGYWTAVYHYQRYSQGADVTQNGMEEEDIEGEGGDEDLVSTQR